MSGGAFKGLESLKGSGRTLLSGGEETPDAAAPQNPPAKDAAAARPRAPRAKTSRAAAAPEVPDYVPPEATCLLGAQVPESLKLDFDEAIARLRREPGMRKVEMRTGLAELVRLLEDEEIHALWAGRVRAATRR